MPYCKANTCYNSTNHSWNDYCSYHERCLSKLRQYNSDISNIKEIETFETWFNKNCSYVINYNYNIWIVVYEPAVGSMSENIAAIKYENSFGGLSGARDKAQELKNKLQNNGFYDTPMLEVHPRANSYEKFSSLITSPYVVERKLPIRTETHPFESNYMLYRENALELHLTRWMRRHYPNNPDSYLKPLDIVKVDEGIYKHVGVYLGNNEVCHFSKKYNGVRVHSWSDFLEDFKEGNGEIICYHPMIPFKSHFKIARQIAWAKKENFREGIYALNDRNCEHFANMIIYGINYSEQIYNNFSWGNNGKGSTIKLINEMSESNGKLSYTDGYHWLAKEIERKYEIEVPPKQNEWDCRIM